MTDVGVAFRDADGPMQPALRRCLDFMNNLPDFRAYKKSSWESLRIAPEGKYLDVACGVGFDASALAADHLASEFVGIDKSLDFLAQAVSRSGARRNLAFVAAQADRLPFPDGAFDGARIDRSLQHMADPAAALAEMARVVRPGGRIVATEPDWGTFLLFNGDRATSDKMAAKWRESFAQPAIGRELGALFEGCGVTGLGLRAHVVASMRFEEAEVIYDLARLQENCVAAGVFSAKAGAEWRARAERASRAGVFLACLTIIERWGVVE